MWQCYTGYFPAIGDSRHVDTSFYANNRYLSVNALLFLGPYYTAFDLAEFARQLDDAEKEHMKEGDVNSAEFLKFMEVSC